MLAADSTRARALSGLKPDSRRETSPAHVSAPNQQTEQGTALPTKPGRRRPTLKVLRREAPRQDRNSEALAPAPASAARPSYPSRFARTVEELRERCGDHGDLAVLEARYSAVQRWQWDWPTPNVPHPEPVSFESLRLCREEAWFASGLPHIEGGPRPLPIIDRISPESKLEARTVTADVMRAWERAGKPHLTPARITDAHQYILAHVWVKQSENRA